MNDRKRTARYGFAFIILAVLLVILFIWNVNAGQHPPVSGRDPEYHIQASGNRYRLQYYMGNPSARILASSSWEEPVRIRISPADLFQ